MNNKKQSVWEKEDIENIKIYEELLSKHGISYKSLDYGSKKSQLLRYKILSEIGIQSNDTVIDIGCGLADLYKWFKNQNINIDYTGTDITPVLVEEAQKRFPSLEFHCANILEDTSSLQEKYDYVVASGIFAKRYEGGTEYVYALIEQMYNLAGKGLSFNSLNSLSPLLDEDDFGLDPLDMLRFCRTLTPWVTLRQDYHPNDMTVYLYREQQG